MHMATKSYLTKSRPKGHRWTVFVCLFVVLVAFLLAVFGFEMRDPTNPAKTVRLSAVKDIRFGIDIRGGVEAVFMPDPSSFEGRPSDAQLDAVKKIMETRLDNLQVLDRDVIVDKTNARVSVRFPWKSGEKQFDPDRAIKELGETAKLSFTDPDGQEVLTGSDVESATATVNSQTNLDKQAYMVSLKLKPEGAQKFADATQRLMNKAISIKMDDTLISNPVVRAHITNGEATISPMANAQEAIDLADKINAGALPFAIKAVSSRSLSPDLGSSALEVMTRAGALAFILLCIFLIFHYRLSGVVASVSLLAQVIGILLAISIPQQTLTLQGIAGIILSIGMGVDANVIESERIREELRAGANTEQSVRLGYDRAFSSILDGNVTVAFAALCLIFLGSGSMLSFGYSLLVGVILNLVCGATLSKLMTRSLIQYRVFRKPTMFLSKRKLAAVTEVEA